MPKLSSEQRKFLDSTTMQYLAHLDLAEDFLERRGITMDHAKLSGLGVVVDPPQAHNHLRGRLCIPYMTSSGVVCQSFRCMQDHDCKAVENHSKYGRATGNQTRLYGALWYDLADDFIVLTEGEIDALTLHQLNIPALGVPGAKNWLPHWTSILQDFSTVYVFSDGDKDGQDFAKRVLSEYDRSINVKMPDGEDVNSAYVKFGAEFLLRKLGSDD
jgi:hypothetical protein